MANKPKKHPTKGKWLIPLTLFIALFLSVLPYPDWMKHARPDWVTLVLFYWCLAVPNRVSVGTGWLMGICLDILHFTLIGQHAIGKAFVALVANIMHKRWRMYHLWQQCFVVMILTTIDTAIVVWVSHLTSQSGMDITYWQLVLTTTLLWPIAYTGLRFLRRKARIE